MSKNTLILLGSAVLAIVLWVLFRPKGRWFPGASNQTGVLLIGGGMVVGLIVALVVKYLRSK